MSHHKYFKARASFFLGSQNTDPSSVLRSNLSGTADYTQPS